MGILNTAGNLISLLSMTFLGLYRLKVILRIKQCRKTRHKDIKLITMIVALVFIMSLTISIVPVIPLFNEYFINAYYYGNATVILVGAQDKKSHLKLISAFHGRTRLDNNWYSWALLQRLLFYNVFTSTKSITVRKIGFYGNEAVCIFKYIVTKEDDQKVFSLTVLGLHFGCLLAIVLSYMVIRRKIVKATRKFDRVLKNGTMKIVRKSKAVNKKITFIIITEFVSWIPFITLCVLHYFEVLDGSDFYHILALLVIPINSLINPLIYHMEFFDGTYQILKKRILDTFKGCHLIWCKQTHWMVSMHKFSIV